MTDTENRNINVELLDRTLAYIEAHPEEWDQGNWRCGTGMCFAGWAVTLAGREWAGDPGGPAGELLVRKPDEPRFAHTLNIGEDRIHVEDAAANELGLTEDDRDMFNDDKTLYDLRDIVADLKAIAGAA